MSNDIVLLVSFVVLCLVGGATIGAMRREIWSLQERVEQLERQTNALFHDRYRIQS